MNPHYELPCPPPPQTVIFRGDPPPFKRDIIIIKPDMHRFCSVQYDWYFLFSVKLLTSHSTDVAATSVNSKNEDSLSAPSLSLSRVCSINGSGPSGFIWRSQCLAITFTLSFLGLLMCWCSPWCLRYLLGSGTRSCFSLVESSHRSFQA